MSAMKIKKGDTVKVITCLLYTSTIRANNSVTFPEYLENRFHDKKKVLLLISSIVIVIFFLVYTASALAAGGKLFASVFGMDYTVALTIRAAVILAYTFMGGFMAVCTTDFIQGMPVSYTHLLNAMALPTMARQSRIPRLSPQRIQEQR